MDQISMVKIEDGTKLIDQLGHDNFDVKAAYWLYTSQSDEWFLYLVSDEVNRKGITEAYKVVYKAMRTMTNLLIDRFEVKLIGPDDPVAKAVMDFLSNPRARIPTGVRGVTLGNVYIENAYIYAPTPASRGGIRTELSQAATPGPVQ